MKPKEAKYEDEFVEDKKDISWAKLSMDTPKTPSLDDNGLDYHSLNGVHPEVKVEELEKYLREEKK